MKCMFALLVFVLLLYCPLGADNRHNFTIINKGYHDIFHVWITDPDGAWGDDQLANDEIIAVGGSKTWTLESQCDQSIAIRFSDHIERYWRPLDTCAYDLTTTH